MLTKIDRVSRLYVVKCGAGFTCLGFDVAEKWGAAVAAWAGFAWSKIRKGTRAHYAAYGAAMTAGEKCATATGSRCPAELTPQLNGLEGKRVEVVDAYGETRRFKVGMSTGWMPCHLEIANSRSSGGGSVTGAPFKSVRVIR